MEIRIDEEFRSLLPPQTRQENSAFRESVKRDGIREPIDIWEGEGIVLDGHHRFDAAEVLNLEYEYREHSFPDRAAAMRWIMENQLARRNLNPTQFKLYWGRYYNVTKKGRGDAGMAKITGKTPNPQIEGLAAAKAVAEASGVSRATIERAGKLAESVDNLAHLIRRDYESGKLKMTDDTVHTLASLSKADQSDLARQVHDRDCKSIREALAASYDMVDDDSAEAAVANGSYGKAVTAKLNQAAKLMRDLPDLCGLEKLLVACNSIVSDIDNARAGVRHMTPAAVCKICNGKKCAQCGNHGWVSALEQGKN